MISTSDYIRFLRGGGENISQVRKNASDEIQNATFLGSIDYKRVYILDPDDGWKYTDARYSKHTVTSIAKDAVDIYLQFRPKEHYPIGTYVFIPDDTSFELDIDEQNPLSGNCKDLWMIVNRNDSKQFVRYLVLKCNWNFKWITDFYGSPEIFNCWGCARNANSYTSGVWHDEYITTLDNLTSMWLPNSFYLYSSNLSKYGLCDTRSITISNRFMITLNTINPNCYYVTKILDMTPMGIIKIYLKQDDYNPKRDNAELMLCDYYYDTGDIKIENEKFSDEYKNSFITSMIVNDSDELVPYEYAEFDEYGEQISIDDVIKTIDIAKLYYYTAHFSQEPTVAHWRVEYAGDVTGMTNEDIRAIENLFVVRVVNDNTVSIKAGKSNKVKGVKINLVVSDEYGNYSSSILLEVNS